MRDSAVQCSIDVCKLRIEPYVAVRHFKPIARLSILLGSTSSHQSRSVLLRRLASAAGLLIRCAHLAITLSSLRCFTIQQDESNILIISAAGLRSLPIYNPPASPDSSYSLMYGPVTFLIYSVASIAGGIDHFWIVRAAVVIANLGLCAAFMFFSAGSFPPLRQSRCSYFRLAYFCNSLRCLWGSVQIYGSFSLQRSPYSAACWKQNFQRQFLQE
jgi:hypothetical protein